MNKLIWGDNKLVLSSLKNGPVRREIESAGGLKLIYIDSLELTSGTHEYAAKGRYKIAVKVIDIFGNDTTKVVEVKI